MSVVPNIFSGMTGKEDARVTVLSCGQINEQLTNRAPLAGRVEYEKAPNLLNSSIDYSTARAVLPSKGITHNVLRVAPVPASNTFQVNQGFGADQPKGLASRDYYPTDYPVLRPFDSLNIGQLSSLIS